MAIHRGVQSAVFWYASCAPCTERKYKKQRRREIERGRLEREILAGEIPNMYRHPDPSATNPHWQSEIDSGPVLVGRRWKGYSEDPRKKTSKAAQRKTDSDHQSSPDLPPTVVENRDGRYDSKFDIKQHQRDDDELWGSTSTERLGFSRSWQNEPSDAVTIPPRALTRGSDSSSRYVSPRNPQINDLHPATVTKINSRDDARWMFQPPPPAEVMLGKTKAPRSRSDSGNSGRLSSKSAALPLSKDLSYRMMEKKLINGTNSLKSTVSRESSGLVADGSKSPENEKTTTAETDFADPDQVSLNRPRTRSAPLTINTSDDSTDSTTTVLQIPYSDPTTNEAEEPTNRRLASRPQLTTIISDSLTSSLPEDNPQPPTTSPPKENGHPNPSRTTLLTKDDSLRVLQELAPSSRIFKTQLISPDDMMVRASKKGIFSPDRAAAGGQDAADVDDPEIFEAWDTADFALPDWIHEHTKREVKERWSMDI